MKISLSRRPLTAGREALYLNACHEGHRTRRSLGIILEEGNTTDARRRNRERLALARHICAKYELEQVARLYNMGPVRPQNLLLMDAWKEFEFTYANCDRATVSATGRYLASFVGRRRVRLPQDVTPEFCQQFYADLCTKLHGTTPNGYFNKFRTFLRRYSDMGYWSRRPDHQIHTSGNNIEEKTALTAEELQKLAATPCTVPDVARAFLFSCNTGLRWCDVRRLRGSNINWESGTLSCVQHKVAGRSRHDTISMVLNGNALSLLPHCRTDRLLFRLPSYTYTLRVLKRWTKEAGVERHVTFHCARHTFITQLVLCGTPLPVIALLAGHASTRHTERYVHIAEKQCRLALARLPRLEFTASTGSDRSTLPDIISRPLSAATGLSPVETGLGPVKTGPIPVSTD